MQGLRIGFEHNLLQFGPEFVKIPDCLRSDGKKATDGFIATRE